MRKILIVDDDTIILDLLSSVLSSNNYEVIAAKNGVEAYELLKIDKPDLILLDRMMPGMSGDVLCKSIKTDKEFKKIKIIMLTANSLSSDKVSGLEFGADDYMTKPFDTNELLARIKKQISIKESTEKIESELFIAEHMKIIGKMASSIAHDFTNILSSFTYFEMIREVVKKIRLTNPENKEIKLLLEQIITYCETGISGLRLGKSIAEGMVLMSRGASSKFKNEPLEELISATLNMFSKKFLDGNIELEYNNYIKDQVIFCNSGEIHQVILNLISNSYNSVIINKELRKIIVDIDRIDDKIIIKVEDNGEGIEPKNIAKVFEEYFTTGKEGHGIGLYTVKRIVDNHNGEVDVFSISDVKTIFTVSLPHSEN